MSKARRLFKQKYDRKVTQPVTFPGVLGNPGGIVAVPGRPNYVYVRALGDQVLEVYNTRVTPKYGLPVVIGTDPSDPGRQQVLSVRSGSGTAVEVLTSGYAPADRYRWMAPGGGQDPLFVEMRQFLPLRVAPVGGLSVAVYPGIIYVAGAWYLILRQTIGLAEHVPETEGMARFVLIAIDEEGELTTLVGDEVAIADLAITDIPEMDPVYRPLAAVRLYYGQPAIYEGRSNTDMVDLRWSQGIEALSTVSWDDITNKPELSTSIDWNRNKLPDNSEMVGFNPADYFRKATIPLTINTNSRKATLETMTGFGLPDITNPAVDVGEAADSDAHIREIGNVLYEPFEASRKYKLFYTGWKTDVGTDEKIHYAYSEDGKTWTKSTSNPVISTRRAEDPYVVRNGDTYYLYAEDKTAGGANLIRRWHSSDCETWTDDGQCTGLGDAQSPLVWIEDDVYYMLFERYPATPSTINLATSSDGLVWTQEATNPVMVAADTDWSTGNMVPDDILKIGATYYLSYHGHDGESHKSALAKSYNLTTWIDLDNNPMSDYIMDYAWISTAMFLLDSDITFFYYRGYPDDLHGIIRGFPAFANSTNLTISSGAITIDKDYHLLVSESGTADDLSTINGGVDGQVLVLQAYDVNIITVKHGTGNIYLNNESDLVLEDNKSIFLFFNGTYWSSNGISELTEAVITGEILMDDDDPRNMLLDDDGDLIYE